MNDRICIFPKTAETKNSNNSEFRIPKSELKKQFFYPAFRFRRDHVFNDMIRVFGKGVLFRLYGDASAGGLFCDPVPRHDPPQALFFGGGHLHGEVAVSSALPFGLLCLRQRQRADGGVRNAA